jgi:hypothetical protein
MFVPRSLLFSSLSDDGDGCIECVGTIDTVAAFNMMANAASHLDIIYFLFPNIQHLVGKIIKSNFTPFLYHPVCTCPGRI